jgi:soluble lytic murein transglycosylase-like protein/tetratricopeptide (TPR) repeat protein
MGTRASTTRAERPLTRSGSRRQRSWFRVLALVGMLGGTLAAGAWLSRHAAQDPPGPEPRPVAPAFEEPPPEAPPPPVGEWSARFLDLQQEGRWHELARLLQTIQLHEPEVWQDYRLPYLLGRAAAEAGNLSLARSSLQPFLEEGDPFRPHALHRLALLEAAGGDPREASRLRRRLIAEHPESLHVGRAIEDELAFLDRQDPGTALVALEGLRELLPAARHRELGARVVEILAAQDDLEAALAAGMRLLRQGVRDDAAERVARALDRPLLLPHLGPEELEIVGQALHAHRHFDRAAEVLGSARDRLPGRRHGELDFAIGRAYFFAERFEAAKRSYIRAAGGARSGAERARYFFHASRAAHLLEQDDEAEELAGRAIAVPGRHAGTSAALAKRMKIRLHQGRGREAARDLAELRRYFPREETLANAGIYFALHELAQGRPHEALARLEAIPRSAQGRFHPSEIAYWRARALERREPAAAVELLLEVMTSPEPTHHAIFARRLLELPHLTRPAAELAGQKRRQAAHSLEAGELEEARRLQLEAALLSRERSDLRALEEIYRRSPQRRAVLDVVPLPLPELPLSPDSPDELLLALGLFDDGATAIPRLYPLDSLASGLTRSLAYSLGGRAQLSIRAAEATMREVPDGFTRHLLPGELRRLLHPRPYLPWILEESRRQGADPLLVLSIMREESRFDPRAKSPAAARGLMQFVIATGREVGREVGLAEVLAEDLYDPATAIQLGARYLATRLELFGGDPYAAAASYNAGPYQAREWVRLAPAPGPDFLLSTIDFQETKGYVRVVMNSYERYREIYGEG